MDAAVGRDEDVYLVWASDGATGSATVWSVGDEGNTAYSDFVVGTAGSESCNVRADVAGSGGDTCCCVVGVGVLAT